MRDEKRAHRCPGAFRAGLVAANPRSCSRGGAERDNPLSDLWRPVPPTRRLSNDAAQLWRHSATRRGPVRESSFRHVRLAIPRALFGALAVTVGVACRSDSIVALDAGERNRRVAARVGEQIDITLQSIGPGEYASPPALSSSAIVFLDVGYCGNLPAGVTQCFHFRAAAPGQAVLVFTHSGFNPSVQDTVDVR